MDGGLNRTPVFLMVPEAGKSTARVGRPSAEGGPAGCRCRLIGPHMGSCEEGSSPTSLPIMPGRGVLFSAQGHFDIY